MVGPVTTAFAHLVDLVESKNALLTYWRGHLSHCHSNLFESLFWLEGSRASNTCCTSRTQFCITLFLSLHPVHGECCSRGVHTVHTQCNVFNMDNYPNPSFGLFPQATGFRGWKVIDGIYGIRSCVEGGYGNDVWWLLRGLADTGDTQF